MFFETKAFFEISLTTEFLYCVFGQIYCHREKN